MATRESINKRERTVEDEEQTMVESTTNQTKVSLTMVKHLFSKESDKNVVFRRCHSKLRSASWLLPPRVLHNNSFSTSSVPNPLTISTPSPLILFPSSYLMLLLPVGLASLSSKVCGLIKLLLFNLPSKKLWLMITKPLWLQLISRTRYVFISSSFHSIYSCPHVISC